jgi:large subunit ribosomal protein L29
MKIEKWRELGPLELQHKLVELQDSLLSMRFKVQTKQVENTAQLSGMRRDIARIKTLLKETAVQGGATAPAAAAQSAPAAEKPAAKKNVKEPPAAKVEKVKPAAKAGNKK